MVAMTEVAVPSQQQQQSTTTKAKAKEKKSSAAAAAASSATAAAGQSQASGATAKAKNVVERKPPPSPPPPTPPQDPFELEMARQDLLKVAHPDTHTPFASLEDACERLLPYHILAEYEFEEDDEEGKSKAQAWEETLKTKTQEFVATLEKQVILYNSIMMKQSQGEMRGEERMMVEQSLLMEEKQKLSNVRAQIEAKEKEEKEEAEAKAKEALAMAERARAEEQARAEAEAQARAEADAMAAETHRAAEADSLAQVESKARTEGATSAVPSEPATMTGLSGTSANGSWEELEDDADEDADNDQEDDEDSEGDWDDEGHDEDALDDEDDNSSEDPGTMKMSTDDGNQILSSDRVPKPS